MSGPPGNGGATAATPLTTRPESQEKFSDIVDAVARNHEGITKIVEAVGTEFTKARNAHLNISRQLSWMVFGFMALIVGGCGWLVYTGHLDGNALTLVIGIIIGYMMRFVERLEFSRDDGDG